MLDQTLSGARRLTDTTAIVTGDMVGIGEAEWPDAQRNSSRGLEVSETFAVTVRGADCLASFPRELVVKV